MLRGLVLRGLKLLNTAISTTAITIQSSRFFAMSFMCLNSYFFPAAIAACLLRALAGGNRVGLRAARARRLRFAHADALISLAQVFQVLVEATALKQFDHERAAGFQVASGKFLS